MAQSHSSAVAKLSAARLIWRSAFWYWPQDLAAALALAVAVAVLAGALIVGWSLSASLQQQLTGRLAGFGHAIVLPTPTAGDLPGRLRYGEAGDWVGMLQLPGVASKADESSSLAVGATVWGCPAEDWAGAADLRQLGDGEAIVNQRLAAELKLKEGDWLLCRVNWASMMPEAGVFALRKPSETTRVVRVLVRRVLPAGTWADLSLAQTQVSPRNIFVRAGDAVLGRSSQVNTLLAAGEILPERIAPALTLADSGFVVRDAPRGPLLQKKGVVFTDEELGRIEKVRGQVEEIAVFVVEEFRAEKHQVSYGILVSDPARYPLKGNRVILNDWVAQDLHLELGDKFTLSVLLAQEDGEFRRESVECRVAGIASIGYGSLHRNVMTELEGITSARQMDQWKTPFPIEHSRISPRDDAYWEKHGPTPKAIISDELMQQFWRNSGFRGRRAVTGIRIGEETPKLRQALLSEAAEWRPRDLLAQARAAGQGSSDFAELFVSLSSFLVIAALCIAVSLSRMGIDARVGEAGLLQALGIGGRKWTVVILTGQLIPSLVGIACGMLIAVLYARGLLLLFQRTSEGTWEVPPLRIAIRWDILLYVALALMVGMLVVGWRHAARLIRRPTRELLWGVAEERAVQRRAASAGSLGIRRLTLRWMGSDRRRVRLAFLVFFAASLILTAVGVYRGVHAKLSLDHEGPAGGFALKLSSPIAYRYDLGSEAGRRNLGINEPLPAGVRIYSLMTGGGDEGGCLNLAKPGAMQVAAVGDDFIARGGFHVQTKEKVQNPWELLRQSNSLAVPVIGDEETMRWIEHRALGDVFVTEMGGRPQTLKLVGMVQGGLFSGQLLMAQERFRALFPGEHGYAMHLVEAPDANVVLPGEFRELGFSIERTGDVVAAVQQVQRIYMSLFLVLGGLGLLLGVAAGGAVLARDLLRKRGELALLLAMGLSRGQVTAVVAGAHALPLVAGVVTGAAAALLGYAAMRLEADFRIAAGLMVLTAAAGVVLAVLLGRLLLPRNLTIPLRTIG